MHIIYIYMYNKGLKVIKDYKYIIYNTYVSIYVSICVLHPDSKKCVGYGYSKKSVQLGTLQERRGSFQEPKML